MQLRTGTFLTPRLSFDHCNISGRNASQRPDVIGAFRYNRTPQRWIDPGSFALANEPASVGDQSCYGTAGRNIIEGPGFANVDFSLYKNIALTERFGTQLRFEFFNLFNRVNFNNPGVSFDPSNLSSFGVIGSTQDARQIQIAVKIHF